MLDKIIQVVLIPFALNIIGGIIAGLIVTDSLRRTLKEVVSKEKLKKLLNVEIIIGVIVSIVVSIFLVLVMLGIIKLPKLEDPVYLIELSTGKVVEYTSKGRKYTGETVKTENTENLFKESKPEEKRAFQ